MIKVKEGQYLTASQMKHGTLLQNSDTGEQQALMRACLLPASYWAKYNCAWDLGPEGRPASDRIVSFAKAARDGGINAVSCKKEEFKTNLCLVPVRFAEPETNQWGEVSL